MRVEELILAGGVDPERVAFETRSRTWTYADVASYALGIARRLVAAGVEPGDRVALILGNDPFHAAAFLAVARTGAIVVEANPQDSPESLGHVLAETQPSLALVASEIARALPAGPGGVRLTCETLEAIPDPGGDLPAPRDEGPVLIAYTAGTTGRPKGVLLTHRNLTSNVQGIAALLDLRPDDRILGHLPFATAYGRSVWLSALASGAAGLIPEEGFTPASAPDRLAALRVTLLPGVPADFLLLASRSPMLGTPLPSLRAFAVGGGSLAPDTIDTFRDAFPHAGFFVMYGLTEATACVAILSPEAYPRARGSSGRPLPGVSLRIAGTEDVGEILVRGPNVMAGYLTDLEGTERALRDGWLHTADVGRIDGDGFLHVTGREKEIPESAGERAISRRTEVVPSRARTASGKRSWRSTAASGFTLLELMIVIAVIAIIAAIAIPNFTRSKVAANESSAIGSLRTISSVIEQYRVRYHSYPGALTDLNAAGYIDDRLGAGEKSGYTFQYTGTPLSYRVQADPHAAGPTGERNFFLDESGIIRWAQGGQAGPADAPIDS